MTRTVLVETPFCQIEKKQIGTNQCLQLQATQTPQSCFGCASRHRLCRKCRNVVVVFPEVDLCSECLNSELEVEDSSPAKQDKPLCAGCQENNVYYEPYNLCLKCTHVQFSPDRQQASDGQAPASQTKVRRRHRHTSTDDDEVYNQALRLVVEKQEVSLKLLMNELGLGQPRGSQILARLRENGVIQKTTSGKAHNVILKELPEELGRNHSLQLAAARQPNDLRTPLGVPQSANGQGLPLVVRNQIMLMGLNWLQQQIGEMITDIAGQQPNQ